MNIAIAVFWPYGFAVEGIRANVDALIDSTRQRGYSAEVILSEVAARDFHGCVVHRYEGSGFVSFSRTVRSFRRVLCEQGHRFDVIICMMRYPSLAFVFDTLPDDIVQRVIVAFDGVITGCELLAKGFSTQSIKLILGQHPLWLRLSRFRLSTYTCSTNYQRQQLLSAGMPPGKLHVVANCISRRLFDVNDTHRARERLGWRDLEVVGYLGHLSPCKGVPTLLQSARCWLCKSPNRRLALALSGRGGGRSRIDRIIRRLGIRDQVEIYGVVDAATYLKALNVAVFPYRHESIMHYPTVLLECSLLGVPLITSDVGGLSEMIRHERTGLLFPPGDSVKLCQAIERMLTDHPLRRRCGASLREEFARKYDADVVLERYLQLAGSK